MREARLVGLSQDGTKLVLAMPETGEEFAVPVDDRLRAALRGDRARLDQLEIQMESALRPRDIQARIRAGESPEAVAAVAQMPMERVMAFAGPVLAERALTGYVEHPNRVHFGSESAWWNDQSDAYFDLYVSDGALFIQMMNRIPGRCGPQIPCQSALMKKQ